MTSDAAPQQDAIDPITLEVFWSRLLALVEEQAASLIRSAFSPSVADAGDISACAFDRRGYMIAQAVTGTPGHINSMARCIEHALAAYPESELHPGDVLITNDPWKTSGHLNDIAIVTPVFRGHELVAFFGNICHMADIGGRPFSADAPELFEEGLFIPYTKLFSGSEPNEELLKIVRANVRQPDMVVGDLYAMATANDAGAERLLQFMDEFQLDSIQPLAEEVIARSETAMRDAIAALPDGVYSNELTMDGYDEPVTLKVAITIAGDEILVDYAGSSPVSRRGINVVMNYTEAYTTFGLKSALVPDVPNNEGSFRPVTIRAPRGSILNCEPPVPVAGRHIVGQWLPTVVQGALLPIIPDQVLAEGCSNLWNVQFSGTDPHGQPWTMLFFNSGGTGARPTKDGLSSTAFPSGVYGTPAEIIEAASPLLCLKREFRTDSGGPGKYRGGLGHWLVLRAVGLDRPYRLSPFFDRMRYPARGYLGGKEGAPGEYRLSSGETPHPKATRWLQPDEEIVLGLPGGGGFHQAWERSPDAVLDDVLNELVSPDRAEADYGVVLKERSEIDHAATHEMRSARRASSIRTSSQDS